MAKRPVRIMRRVNRPANPGALKGATLFQPVTAIGEFTNTVAREFDMMARECQREILQAYSQTGSPAILNLEDGATMDAASLTTVMSRLLKKLRDRFERQFKLMADNAVPRMIDRVNGDSSQRLRASLKDISEDLVINFDRTPQALKDVIAAGSKNAAMYIKLVPAKYLDEVEGAVFRSISTGMGLQDLVPALEKQKVEKLRWAKNVAMDQTRKVYNTINKERMRSVGITKFEWVHSGGSNQPREYHKYTLNGNVYDIDDPPIIDQRTGERGFPGQLPYCLPAGSKVENTDGILQLYRHFYTGELITLVTSEGAVLKTTPNHPVLTRTGWKPAGLVNEGEYLVDTGDHCLDGFKRDVDDGVASIDELFDTAFACFGVGVTIGGDSGLEFHGDLTDKEIDIVDAHGMLAGVSDPEDIQYFCEIVLAFADSHALPQAESDSAALLLMLRSCAPSTRVVCSLYPLLSVLWAGGSRANEVGLALAAYMDARIQEASTNGRTAHIKRFRECQLAFPCDVSRDYFLVGNILSGLTYCTPRNSDATGAKGNAEVVGIDAESLGSLFKHEAGGEHGCRVVQKVVSEFAGHVYNLHNVRNWYSSTGLIVHNCRCTMRPILSYGDTESNDED